MKSSLIAGILIHLYIKRNNSCSLKRKYKKCCWGKFDQDSRNVIYLKIFRNIVEETYLAFNYKNIVEQLNIV